MWVFLQYCAEVCHMADTIFKHTHTETYRQCRVTNEGNVHVFGLEGTHVPLKLYTLSLTYSTFFSLIAK